MLFEYLVKIQTSEQIAFQDILYRTVIPVPILVIIYFNHCLYN